HTSFSRDWSSDVCSSDLAPLGLAAGVVEADQAHPYRPVGKADAVAGDDQVIEILRGQGGLGFGRQQRIEIVDQVLRLEQVIDFRSEERRVGSERGVRRAA